MSKLLELSSVVTEFNLHTVAKFAKDVLRYVSGFDMVVKALHSARQMSKAMET